MNRFLQLSKQIIVRTMLVGVLCASFGGIAYAAPATPAPSGGGDAKAQVCEGLSSIGGGCDNNGSGVSGIIKLAVNTLSLLVGVAAVIMILIGGFKYITSQGESSNTASAKSTILYAIVGLVIVALAQFIVRFTLTQSDKASSGVTCPTGQSLQSDHTCK